MPAPLREQHLQRGSRGAAGFARRRASRTGANAGAACVACPGQTHATAQAAAPPNVRPALPSAAVQLMVQIAAVSNPEDADVLVDALRKRGYPVTRGASRRWADPCAHRAVHSRDEANRMCMRLLDDGYNAMVQP